MKSSRSRSRSPSVGHANAGGSSGRAVVADTNPPEAAASVDVGAPAAACRGEEAAGPPQAALADIGPPMVAGRGQEPHAAAVEAGPPVVAGRGEHAAVADICPLEAGGPVVDPAPGAAAPPSTSTAHIVTIAELLRVVQGGASSAATATMTIVSVPADAIVCLTWPATAGSRPSS